MYEFHGWISIRMSPDPQDETESSGVIAQIQEWLNAIPEYGSCIAEWHVLNGSDMVVVQGLLNRPRGIDTALAELYARVGAAAPGSYGLLYALDDDVQQDFTVLVLRRGKVEQQADPFFSPFVPIVEDPDEL
jgi:Immunity protein 7